MAHTPGPWSVGTFTANMPIGPHKALSVHPPWAAEGEVGAHVCLVAPLAKVSAVDEANAAILALAPTAPHDCDLPSCPGAENKRKLEAAEKLLAACKESLKWQAEGEFGDPVPGVHAATPRGHRSIRAEPLMCSESMEERFGDIWFQMVRLWQVFYWPSGRRSRMFGDVHRVRAERSL